MRYMIFVDEKVHACLKRFSRLERLGINKILQNIFSKNKGKIQTLRTDKTKKGLVVQKWLRDEMLQESKKKNFKNISCYISSLLEADKT